MTKDEDGHLVPLKTLYELEVQPDLVDAFVVEFPVEYANKAVRAFKASGVIRGGDGNSFSFLRRLVTVERLPLHLRDCTAVREGVSTICLLLPPLEPPVTRGEVDSTLRSLGIFQGTGMVKRTQVPREAPKTADQAFRWSDNYWPCVFNPASANIQKAPPWQLRQAVWAELNDSARLGSYFSVAQQAARECRDAGIGRPLAALIVDPADGQMVAAAGDARWYSASAHVGGCPRSRLAEGIPHQHALMRAIAMVAVIRHQKDLDLTPSVSAKNGAIDFQGQKPLTPIENPHALLASHSDSSPLPRSSLSDTTPRPDPYLCTGLDVYLTHEPCVACSMAMIHSRFRACVFQFQMPFSGGLCAESGGRDDGNNSDHDNGKHAKDSTVADGQADCLGLGLFWRKELNWRVLTFQYLPKEGIESKKGCDGDAFGPGKDLAFHA